MKELFEALRYYWCEFEPRWLGRTGPILMALSALWFVIYIVLMVFF